MHFYSLIIINKISITIDILIQIKSTKNYFKFFLCLIEQIKLFKRHFCAKYNLKCIARIVHKAESFFAIFEFFEKSNFQIH